MTPKHVRHRLAGLGLIALAAAACSSGGPTASSNLAATTTTAAAPSTSSSTTATSGGSAQTSSTPTTSTTQAAVTTTTAKPAATTTTKAPLTTTTARPTTTTTAPTTTLVAQHCSASMTNPTPGTGGSDTVVINSNVPDSPDTIVAHYKTTDHTFNDRTDAAGHDSYTFSIGHPTAGYTVRVDVTIQRASCSTSFTPQ